MNRLILYLGILCFVVYSIYKIYWNISSLFQGTIKKNEEQGRKDLSKSVNWVALTLLSIAVICCLILYFGKF